MTISHYFGKTSKRKRRTVSLCALISHASKLPCKDNATCITNSADIKTSLGKVRERPRYRGFAYDGLPTAKLLYNLFILRVANITCRDVKEYLSLSAEMNLRHEVQMFALKQAN
jgi:hypothetical protein